MCFAEGHLRNPVGLHLACVYITYGLHGQLSPCSLDRFQHSCFFLIYCIDSSVLRADVKAARHESHIPFIQTHNFTDRRKVKH